MEKKRKNGFIYRELKGLPLSSSFFEYSEDISTITGFVLIQSSEYFFLETSKKI